MPPAAMSQQSPHRSERDEVAIIGMACLFPGAPDLAAYWHNIINKVDCITDPPAEAWDADLYYDPASTENDRVYCKRGGYIGPLAQFDPLAHGIMPAAVEGGEPDQWLALKLARDALTDAGYGNLPPEGHRTAVILGKGNYLNRGNLSLVQNNLVVDQTLAIIKKLHPEISRDDLAALRRELRQCLPVFSAETVSGLIPNVIAGRIANRLDLMGPCYTVDGACASSLLAIDIAVHELLDGSIDLAIVGGSQVSTPVPVLGVFCQLNALSRSQQIRPFDKDADGTILGEGIGMIILKRRADAQRDGNRMYALIKGVGTSSDGRGLGVLAPRAEGQALALQRAYERAQVDPASIGLIEAHGTGTLAGDVAEIQSLRQVFGQRTTTMPRCAIGSVKSMIGHTMPAAGIAGIIKAALALYHRVLPPTLNIDVPNPQLELQTTPFYLNTETRPWIHGLKGTPRRAGVNAFGFGGINAHAILEEHTAADESRQPHCDVHQETEVFILQGKTREDLLAAGTALQRFLAGRPRTALKDIAFTINCNRPSEPYRLAIVAPSLDALRERLSHALQQLSSPACTQIKDRRGIYFFEQPLHRQGRLAFLFPGEGSQYINMLADLCIHFPEVRQCFDRIDGIFSGHARGYLLSDIVFPPPCFSETERKEAARKLWEMDGAVEALLTANEALLTLLRRLELQPDVILGHSTGEYSAMHAAGVFSLIDSADNGERARALNQHYAGVAARSDIPRSHLVAIGTDAEKVKSIIDKSESPVFIAMDNCPHQTVVAGPESAVIALAAEMSRQGVICQDLPFDRPYHTPLFREYAETLKRFFKRWPVAAPHTPIYSCTTMKRFPEEPDSIRKLAVDHWVRPVEFRKTIQKMYNDGIRIFVEVGPRGNLTAFVDDILRGRQYAAVPANTERHSSITQINHLIGILAAHGVPLNLDYLYSYRSPKTCALNGPADGQSPAAPQTPVKKLPTGWPSMSISDTTAQRLAAASGAGRIEAAAPPPGYGAPAGDLFSQAFSALSDMEKLRSTQSGRDSSDEVMAGYLNTMEQFLEVQQQVLQSFVGSGAARRADSQPAGDPQPGGRASEHQVLPSHSVQPEGMQDPPLQGLRESLLDIVSERTGYPKDMLDLNLNMEADLGIDSIKRTEILGVLSERYGGAAGQSSEQFSRLKTLGQILDFFNADLNASAAGPARPAGAAGVSDAAPAITPGQYPLLDRIVSIVAGQELVALKTIRLDEDLYLLDHTLGGSVSQTNSSLLPLPVMPLTLSMELLAEAAALLVPDKQVTGMKNIRAYTWIAPEERSLELRIEARQCADVPHEVTVRISVPEDAKAGGNTPAVEGTVVFADSYPAAPPLSVFALRNERASAWSSGQLYTRAMFHGPCWQGVRSVDRWGEDGSAATLEVLPVEGFFHSLSDPRFITDPVVLDAAGQLVGFWTMEHLKDGFLVFPYRVKALQIYGPQPALRAQVKCQARIRLIGSTQVLSDIDMIGPDGRLWMRLEGWEDKRFDLPETMYRFLLSPREVIPSVAWADPVASFGDPSCFVCCRTGPLSRGDEKFWQKVFSYLMLNHRERTLFKNLGASEDRRQQWLMGRLAAKDAVRLLLKERYGITAGPADIEIGNDGYGRPVAGGDWLRAVQAAPVLSLSHTSGMATALAGIAGAGAGVGIDIEPLRPLDQTFMSTVFSQGELEILNAITAAERQQWALRLWCAKEALAKALGRGLEGNPRSIAVRGVDITTGTVTAVVQGTLAVDVPDSARTGMCVHTYQDNAYIVASTLYHGDTG